MWLVLAIVVCFVLGCLIVEPAWSGSKTEIEVLFYLCLVVCFGIGAFSVVFLIARALSVAHIFKADLIAITLLATLRLVGRRRRRVNLDRARASDFDLPRQLQTFLVAAFAVSICIATYALLARVIAHPHGDGWDAFAIWNLHARFLFLGGSHWRDGFSNLIPWSHPDYPPLLPAAVAHFWIYLDNDSSAVPATLGMLFTIGTTAFLYASLAINRGHNAAILGTLALLSTPFFIEQGAAQYADIPLSFFFLATLVLLNQGWKSNSRRLLILSGLAAGFAAWTKNEGLLFLLSAVIGQALTSLLDAHSAGPGSLRRMTAFCAGTAPMLALILWYKHLTPPVDLFASPASMIAKVTTILRYWSVLQWFGKEVLRFGDWWIIPLTLVLLAVYFFSDHQQAGAPEASRRASIWTLGISLAGYFVIYVITPNELYWHLRFSLNRLFLALWPAALFLFFSSVSLRSPAKVSK